MIIDCNVATCTRPKTISKLIFSLYAAASSSGELQLSAETFQQQWPESGQLRAGKILSVWVAKDRLPPNIVAGDGFKWGMQEILAIGSWGGKGGTKCLMCILGAGY